MQTYVPVRARECRARVPQPEPVCVCVCVLCGCVAHRLAKVSLCGGLHLGENHRRDLLREVRLLLALDLNNNLRLAVDLNDLERPVLHVTCAHENNAWRVSAPCCWQEIRK